MELGSGAVDGDGSECKYSAGTVRNGRGSDLNLNTTTGDTASNCVASKII